MAGATTLRVALVLVWVMARGAGLVRMSPQLVAVDTDRSFLPGVVRLVTVAAVFVLSCLPGRQNLGLFLVTPFAAFDGAHECVRLVTGGATLVLHRHGSCGLPGLLVAVRTALGELRTWPVHLVASVAVELVGLCPMVVLFRDLDVAAEAIETFGALLCRRPMRSVTQAASLHVAVNHGVCDGFARNDRVETRAAIRLRRSAVTALAIVRRGERTPADVTQVVVAGQTTDLFRSILQTMPIQNLYLIVACLAGFGFRLGRVLFPGVTLTAVERRLEIEDVFQVSFRGRHLPRLELAVGMASLAGRAIGHAVRRRVRVRNQTERPLLEVLAELAFMATCTLDRLVNTSMHFTLVVDVTRGAKAGISREILLRSTRTRSQAAEQKERGEEPPDSTLLPETRALRSGGRSGPRRAQRVLGIAQPAPPLAAIRGSRASAWCTTPPPSQRVRWADPPPGSAKSLVGNTGPGA